MSRIDGADVEAQSRLLELINANWTRQAIAAACQLDLPDRLAGRALAAGELAAGADLDTDALARLLRALVTLDVCHEQCDGGFALGPLGELLRRDHPRGLRHWALLNGGPMWSRWQALADRVRAGGRNLPGEASVARFQRLGTDPAEAELFHGAMSELSRRLDDSLAATLELPEHASIVDIGGGTGQLLAGVLARHKTARGLLFDLQHALDRAPPVLDRHGVSDRCRLQAGSFFDGVPQGADLYLMKSILHDWDDANAVRLLERCAAAMGAGARLLVIERLRPQRMGADPGHRALARSDLNMLVGLAGRERSTVEYRALFERAGLVLRETWSLAAGFSALAVLPVQPARWPVHVASGLR